MLTGLRDIDIEILVKLDNRSLCAFFRTCKTNYKYSKNENLWRRKMLREFPKRSIGFLKDPIRNYNLISNRAKIFELVKEKYKKCWDMSNDYYYAPYEKVSYPELLECVSKEICLNFDNQYLFRGDLIYCFRNIMLWDGEKAVGLEKDTLIPKEFSFPEFPLDHFYNTQAYFIYISPEKIKEAIINFSEIHQRSFITDLQNTYIVKIPWTHHITRQQFADHITTNSYIDDIEATFNDEKIEKIYCFSK